MKKIIGLILLLTLSLCSSGQTATADSVLIPRKWFRAASVDLLRYDDCKQEVKILKPFAAAQKEMIALLAADTLAKAERIGVLDSRLQSAAILSQQLEANCNNQLKDFDKQLRKQKRRSTWQAILIAVGAAGAGYFIHSVAH